MPQSFGATVSAIFDIKFYRERWKAVEEIELQELRASTVQKNWRPPNSILRRSRGGSFSFSSIVDDNLFTLNPDGPRYITRIHVFPVYLFSRLLYTSSHVHHPRRP